MVIVVPEGALLVGETDALIPVQGVIVSVKSNALNAS